jgi:hypothetical protein
MFGSLGRHAGPHLGALAIVFTILTIGSILPVITVGFPGPSESAATIASYFATHQFPVLLCAFLQFGSAIPLGIFTATVASRLQFLGVRAAGPWIALFGGLMVSFDSVASALALRAMAQPGISQYGPLTQALYAVQFGFGGPGFAVPMGLLMAGVSISAGLTKLLPKWVAVLGVVLAVAGELSWFAFITSSPGVVFLIPLTRFAGFVWLIAAGFLLPKSRAEAHA